MADIAKMSPKEVLALPTVKEAFIRFTTDKANAESEFEKEKMYISLQIDKNKDKMAKCDKFTLYSAILSGLATGLSFNPKLMLCYLDIRSGVVTYQTTAAGKIDLLIMCEAIQYVRTLECVFEGDAFKTNIGEVIDWIPKIPRKAGSSPYAVFGIFALPNGAMKHTIVYKDTVDAAKKKSTDSWGLWKPGSDFETEMWKKTCLNQAYKTFRKTKDLSVAFSEESNTPTNKQEPIKDAHDITETFNAEGSKSEESDDDSPF